MKIPASNAAASLRPNLPFLYPAIAKLDQKPLIPQAAALPTAANAAAASCDDGVKHHAAAGTLTYVKDWHSGGAVAFAGDQHITVSYTNSKGVDRTCHVFNTQKGLGGCYFTTCT